MTTSSDIFAATLKNAALGVKKTAATSDRTLAPTEDKASFKAYVSRERKTEVAARPEKTKGSQPTSTKIDDVPHTTTPPMKKTSASPAAENNTDNTDTDSKDTGANLLATPPAGQAPLTLEGADAHAGEIQSASEPVETEPETESESDPKFGATEKNLGENIDQIAMEIPLSDYRYASSTISENQIASSESETGTIEYGPSDRPYGSNELPRDFSDKSITPNSTPTDLIGQTSKTSETDLVSGQIGAKTSAAPQDSIVPPIAGAEPVTSPLQDISSSKPIEVLTNVISPQARDLQQGATTEDIPVKEVTATPKEAFSLPPQTSTPPAASTKQDNGAIPTIDAATTTAPDRNLPEQAANITPQATVAVPPTAPPTDVPAAQVQEVAPRENGERLQNGDGKTGAKDNTITGIGGSSASTSGQQSASDQSSFGDTADNTNRTTAAKNGTPASNGADQLARKTTFDAALTTTWASDVKPLQTGTIQPQAGLLSLQEVTQPGGMTAAGQPRSPAHVPLPHNPAEQIKLAISKQVAAGQNSFRFTLKPAELGQVDIKMDFLADGRMTTTVTVENEKTLHLLQKDQASLEKALDNAGLNTNGSNLNFTLKKQNQNPLQNQFSGNNSGDGANREGDEMSNLPHSVISQQQLKMAYSKNALDINI